MTVPGAPMSAATPIDPSLRMQVMKEAQGAQRLNLAYIGITTGLFAALEGQRLDVAGLADAAGADAGYVERWSDAAAAFGLLDRAADGFALSDLGAAFLPDRPGTLMPMALMTMLTAHMSERAAAFLPTGHQPGEAILGSVETFTPWFGPMLEASFGGLFASQILPSLPVFDEVGERGGLVVDLGCGNGWYLRRLLQRYPKLRGVGLDMGAASIANARARAEAAGLSDRLTFHEGDLHHFTVDEPAQLVAMNRALHHVWADGPERVAGILHDHLAPGGAAVIWEPRWPDDPATLGTHPKLRGMSFMHLTEHLQGNHLLTPALVEAGFGAAGLACETHLFADDTEMVVVARRPA